MEKTDARDVLRQIILTYGRSVSGDHRRLESLLRDLCGSQKREITLLVNAAKENVPTELTSVSSATVPRDILLSRLRSRLEENLSITPQAAQWAVESWALALDQIPSNSVTTDQLVSDRNANAPSPVMDRPASPPTPAPPNFPPGPGFVPDSQPAANTPASPGFVQAGPQPYTPPPGPQIIPPVSPPAYQQGFNQYNSAGTVVVQSKATMALILGIVGILGSWACGLGLLAAIPAWVFGAGELKAITEGRLPASNKGQAQTGMVLGIIGVILTIALGALEMYLGSQQKT